MKKLRLLIFSFPLCLLAACATDEGGVSSCLPDIQISVEPSVAELGDNVTVDVDNFDANICTATLSGIEGVDDLDIESAVTIPADLGISATVFCECADGTTSISSRTLPVRAARLTWNAPTKTVDGLSLINLEGYRLYHGPTSQSRADVIVIDNPNMTDITESFPSGLRFFEITAIANGLESSFSNEVSKDIP